VDQVGIPRVSRGMDFVDQCMRQAALYPRWLVITSLVLTGVAAFWIVAKLFEWAVSLLLVLLVAALVGGVLIWLLS
jgi:hypothetical protein